MLWSCLSTIVFFVWTALHLPVPRVSRKKVPAAICIVFPEFLIIAATMQLADDLQTVRDK